MTTQWFYERDGKHVGPVDEGTVRAMARDGRLTASAMVWCQDFPEWRALADTSFGPDLANLPPPLPVVAPRKDEATLIRRLADYQWLSGLMWIVLGVLLILTVFGAIAGIWNVFVGASRLGVAKRIRRRDPTVPADFEGMAMLAIVGVVNLLLGGIVGLALVGFDFYIRDKVLANADLFDASMPPPLTRRDPQLGEFRAVD